MSASRGAAGANGITLLSIYSLGLGLPFLLTALFTNHFLAGMKRFRRWSRFIHVGAGVILVLMGLAMVTGQLTRFAWWLLQVFPVLGRIG
ncbi:Cytochrome C biogenesis protein transmembrane region [compost metagenome]